MKKCFVVLGGFTFVVLLSTSCCKTCECKDENGDILIRQTECGFGIKSCKETCKEHNLSSK